MPSLAAFRVNQSKRQQRIAKAKNDPTRALTQDEEQQAKYMGKMIAANVKNQAQLDTLLAALPDQEQRTKVLAMIEPHLTFKKVEIVN